MTLVAFALSMLARSAPGAAQQSARDPAAAEALFDRGKRLIEDGHVREACEAFAESQRLDPAGGTRLRLALCHEAEGKLASAWVEFTEVLRAGREAAGEPAKQQERVRIAREHLASIGPRVPRLVVSVAESSWVDGLTVTANGLPRDRATWGIALPTDPGDVEVIASAPQRAAFRTTVHLAESQQVHVDIPVLPVSGGPMGGSGPPHRGGSTGLRPAGVVAGTVGVVALGVGTYFGVRAIGQWNDATGACPAPQCSDAGGVSVASDAASSARVADYAIAGGAVAVAVGVVLYLLGAPASLEARANGVVGRF